MPERADSSAGWILRRAAKAAVAGALTAVGIHHAVGILRRSQAGGSRVLILSYHRVTPAFEASARNSLASLLVSVDALRRQLRHVGRTCEMVSLATAERILAEPAHRGVRDVVAVTFDDGYAEVAEHALPVLQALHVPATVFVPTGYIGTSRRLPHDRIHASLRRAAGAGHPLRARRALPGSRPCCPPAQTRARRPRWTVSSPGSPMTGWWPSPTPWSAGSAGTSATSRGGRGSPPGRSCWRCTPPG